MAGPRPNLTAHLGYWCAATGSLLALGSSAVLYLLDERWTSMADYAATYRDVRIMPFVFWLALAPLVVVAMGSIHAMAKGPKRALSRISFGFTLPYATITGVNYFLQLTYVRQRILRNDLAGLDPWVIANPGSILFPLDLLGYFFLGMATLFAAPLFSGSRLESGLRALLVVNGVMGVGGLLAAVLAPSTTPEARQIGALLAIVWGLTFCSIMALLAVLFRHLAGFFETTPGPGSDHSGG